MSNTKPKTNIDFQVNESGKLVQYFTNPFNSLQGKIIDGVLSRWNPIGFNLTFTFLENTYRS